MKLKRRGLLLKVVVISLALIVVIFMVVNTVIASSVISAMADTRIEKNSATLEDFGLTGESIKVLSADGLAINAYIVPNNNSKGNVLILHGMHGMDATSLFDYAAFIYEAGYTPVCIDMRAHGKSQGESLSFGYNEAYDVLAVIEFLKSDTRFNGKPIILYGLSMGGSTAINVASKTADVNGIIAVSPFSSIQEQVADYMKRDGAPSAFISVFKPFVNLVLWHKYRVSPVKDSPQHAIRTVGNIPIFIIHGDEDVQTNVSQAQLLFDNSSSEASEIWIVDGKDHLIIEDALDDSSKYYRDRVVEFLTKHFNK